MFSLCGSLIQGQHVQCRYTALRSYIIAYRTLKLFLGERGQRAILTGKKNNSGKI